MIQGQRTVNFVSSQKVPSPDTIAPGLSFLRTHISEKKLKRKLKDKLLV